MKTVNYMIETTILGSEDGLDTFDIRKTINTEGKSAIIIALYPTVSILDPYKTDSSTLYLVNKMHELYYNDIHIINLFSKVVSESGISVKKLSKNPENIEYIKSLMNNVKENKTDIIIAWGSSMKRNRMVIEIKKIILQVISENKLQNQLKQLSFLDDNEEEVKMFCPHMLWVGLHGKNAIWTTKNVTIREIMEDLGIKKKKDNSQKRNKKM